MPGHQLALQFVIRRPEARGVRKGALLRVDALAEFPGIELVQVELVPCEGQQLSRNGAVRCHQRRGLASERAADFAIEVLGEHELALAHVEEEVEASGALQAVQVAFPNVRGR